MKLPEIKEERNEAQAPKFSFESKIKKPGEVYRQSTFQQINLRA